MTVLVAWQQLASPQVTIAMSTLGFDWIVLDLEHTSVTTQEAETIFIAAERCGVKPFVRLPSADPYLARRFLDAGAAGLFVPVVESLLQFDDFAQHCVYPPDGKRGLGLVRANQWGDHFDDYLQNFKPIIIAQIETQLGCNNIKEILSSKFLSGVMVGPYDLSADLGIPGQFDDVRLKQLCQLTVEQVRAAGKMIGSHQLKPDPSALSLRINEGYDFVIYGADIIALRYALEGIKNIRS